MVNPQRIALLMVIAISVMDLLGNPLRRSPPGEFKILIKAQKSPQLAEGLVRYLTWDLALRRGLRIGIRLIIDDSDAELRAICSALMDEGLIAARSICEPDLILVI